MWRWGVSLRSVTHMIVRGSHAETSSDTDRPTPAHLAHWRDKIRPARAARGRFRYKTLPAHPFSPHVRYKTLPAHPLSPHVRDKTLPARPKWPNLAQSTHAGRVLYRFAQHNTEQGEFCTEHEAEIERADTTGHQAPCGGRRRNRRAWTRCRRPVRRTNTGSRGQRQTNFAHNFPRSLFETTRKRCNSNDANSIFEQVAGELRAKLLCQRAWPRCRWAAAGPGRASRSTTPSDSKACGDLAGGPPPTGTHSGRASMRDDATPGTPAEPHTAAAQPPGHAKGAGTEVPAPHSATASSRLRPNDRQSWRRRRIHRNMPPTTAAPRPAPPMRPSKPVRARRCFRLGSTAGTSGAT